MHIGRDDEQSWLRSQLLATCNVEQSIFNDWFSGHLNFQIEHHLFPSMANCHYMTISPIVKQFCKDHDIEYTVHNSVYEVMQQYYKSLKHFN